MQELPVNASVINTPPSAKRQLVSGITSYKRSSPPDGDSPHTFSREQTVLNILSGGTALADNNIEYMANEVSSIANKRAAMVNGDMSALISLKPVDLSKLEGVR